MGKINFMKREAHKVTDNCQQYPNLDQTEILRNKLWKNTHVNDGDDGEQLVPENKKKNDQF